MFATAPVGRPLVVVVGRLGLDWPTMLKAAVIATTPAKATILFKNCLLDALNSPDIVHHR